MENKKTVWWLATELTLEGYHPGNTEDIIFDIHTIGSYYFLYHFIEGWEETGKVPEYIFTSLTAARNAAISIVNGKNVTDNIIDPFKDVEVMDIIERVDSVLDISRKKLREFDEDVSHLKDNENINDNENDYLDE